MPNLSQPNQGTQPPEPPCTKDTEHAHLTAIPDTLALCYDPPDGREVVGGREDVAVAVVDVEGEKVALPHHHDVLRVGKPPGVSAIAQALSTYVAFQVGT